MNTVLDKIKRIMNKLVPFQDDAFRVFAKDKDFCQELLRVLLKDPNLVVIDNQVQVHLPIIFFKESVVDLLCVLGDGRKVCVEIQRYIEENHAKRIMQYAAAILRTMCEKGKKLEGIKDVIIIYLTEKDIFNAGSTVYDVRQEVYSDTDKKIETWDSGLQVYYINAEGVTNANIHKYLQILRDNISFSEKYPCITKVKKEMYKNGGKKMSSELREIFSEELEEGVKRGREEGMQQGMQQGIESMKLNWVKYLKSQGMSDDKINTIIMEFSK